MVGDIPKSRVISEAWVKDGILEHPTVEGVVYYSPQYSDENFVYRHISVPRAILKRARELLRVTEQRASRTHKLKLALKHGESESLLPYEMVVAQLRLHMSSDWILYLIHDRDATLCFRRPRRD